MKKTYNVYSTKMTLKGFKALSVSFIFALFFLGMSSSVSAQVALSRAEAGNAVEADFSITQKADIALSDEDAMTVLEAIMQDTRINLRDASTTQEEALYSAKRVFVETTIVEITTKGATVRDALTLGHRKMALQIAKYDPTKVVVDADEIARDVVQRLN